VTLMEMGVAVRERREALRLTQAQLAQQAGIARATVNSLENGKLMELGVVRLSAVLAVLGLRLNIDTVRSKRPTLDDRYAEQKEMV